MRQFDRKSIIVGSGLVLLALAGPALAQEPAPLSPQPAAVQLEPGLAVTYHAQLFRHVDELESWVGGSEGRVGPPIAMFDYQVGDGDVLTSGQDDGVGAEIVGLIHLAKPGVYAFAAQSNDGFRLWIGGVQVLEDPDVHADRFSDFASLKVTQAGWYPLRMLYFERKNTATLELYWRQPGDDEDGTLPLIPAEVFAHLKQ